MSLQLLTGTVWCCQAKQGVLRHLVQFIFIKYDTLIKTLQEDQSSQEPCSCTDGRM